MLQFRNRFGGWKLLANAVRPLLEKAPELTEQHGRLEALIQEADSLVNEQETLRARLRKTTHRRQEIERQGEELRQRLTAGVQNRLGFASDSLVGYGIAPRQKRVRRSKAQIQLEKTMLFLAQMGIKLPQDLLAGTDAPLSSGLSPDLPPSPLTTPK
jgi:DNA repair exonuclease SbcCD ATPase subunit